MTGFETPSFEIGDAREISALLKEPPDVTISSPPYFGLKNYGDVRQIGLERDYDEYISALVHVFGQVYDHTKDTGSLWLILDAFKQKGELKPLPFDVGRALTQETKWKMTDLIIWNKRKTLPWSQKGNLRHVHEYILFFTKTSKYKFYLDRVREPSNLKVWWHDFPERYNPNGKAPSDIWDILIPTQGGWGKPFLEHFCPFPPELVERMVLLTTNKKDLVFDPFGGSGVVLAVASVMKRRALGIDINESYIERFQKSVFPEIKKLWRLRENQLANVQKAQLSFRSGITTLRQIKFAKLLRKQILDKSTITPPLLLISKIGKYKKSKGSLKPISSELILVYKDSMQRPNVESISALCKNKPLRSFGIDPIIRLTSMSELDELGGKLWLYDNGSISHPTRSIDLSDDGLKLLVNGPQMNYPSPLLLSSKRVNVELLDERLEQLGESKAAWSSAETESGNATFTPLDSFVSCNWKSPKN